MNSKEASGKTFGIWLKLRLHGNNFSNSANMDRPSCHVLKVAIAFSNLNFSHIECVTTHYQTFHFHDFGLFATCYHALPSFFLKKY